MSNGLFCFLFAPLNFKLNIKEKHPCSLYLHIFGWVLNFWIGYGFLDGLWIFGWVIDFWMGYGFLDGLWNPSPDITKYFSEILLNYQIIKDFYKHDSPSCLHNFAFLTFNFFLWSMFLASVSSTSSNNMGLHLFSCKVDFCILSRL